MKGSHWIGLALALGYATALVVGTRSSVQYAAQADEGYYLTYATYVARHGVAAYPQLVAQYLQHAATAQYYPHPLRVSAVLVDAVAVRLWGARFGSLQLISFLAFAGLLIVTYVAVGRALNERTACWMTMLLAASPLHLAMARRALADSLVAALLVTSLWLCLRALLAPRYAPRRWWSVAGCYLATFLAKEGTLMLIPCSWLLIGWVAVRRRQRIPWWPWCAVSVAPLLSAAAVMVLASGGIHPAWQVICRSITSPLTNPYTIRYGSGPWFQYIIDYLLLSPWTTLLAVMWLGALAAARETREVVWAWALVPLAFLVGGAWMTKNVRYLLVLETPLRLGAVLLLQQLLRDREGCLGATVRMAAVLGCLMMADLGIFVQLFLIGHLYDPISYSLLQLRHIIPP